MSNLACRAIGIVMAVSLALMVWMIYTVMAQPMVFAAEKQELLKPGYMPEVVERSKIDSKRFSRSEGYLYSPVTGTTQRVEIWTYGSGKNATYTIRTGHVTVEEHKIEGNLRKED